MSKWARWRAYDGSEEHIAPCDDDGKTIIGGHELDGTTCWCRPRRDDEFPQLIIHKDRERGGFDA